MCIYAHIFIMYMFAWVFYMCQNVHAYVHMLRQKLSHIHIKRMYAYMLGCVYPCIFIY